MEDFEHKGFGLLQEVIAPKIKFTVSQSRFTINRHNWKQHLDNYLHLVFSASPSPFFLKYI